MNAEELRGRFLPMLMSGARNQTLDGNLESFGASREQALLNALSLTGQALRFTRLAAPKEYAVESWPKDERTILPDGLRSPVVRLLDKSTEDSARAVAVAMEAHQLRPHPFDLPRMDGFVRRHADRLGVTAQYWAQRDVPAARAHGYFDATELSADNWTEVPLRLRARFLREMRGKDAEAARLLLEKSWSSEDADSRVQLIAVLQTDLSNSDREFLERNRKDRAPRVRALAQRFLALLSGAVSDNPAVAACMERIQKSRSGLLKKHDVLKMELPATVKEHETNRWVQEQFADVTIDELVRACEMENATALTEACLKDANLLFALALMATREKRFGLLSTLADELPDAWGRMAESYWEDASLDEPQERAEWARALIRPRHWLPERPFPAWSWLHRQMEGPLPEPVMGAILESQAWTALLDGEVKPGTELVQVFCALCPAGLRAVLLAQIEPLDVERRDKGWMLLEILDSLERVK